MNKKWRLWRWLAFASILIGIVLAIFQQTLNDTANPGDFAWQAIALRFFGFAPLCFFVFALLVVLFRFERPIFRWLFTWRTQKWFLRVFVVLIFLAALFYAEEDWRGKRDWENCKNELEAKGEKLDFASFVPPPVPDDQNFALTPIVASCYNRYLDNDGHRIRPEKTKVVNRLEMKIGGSKDKWEGNTNTLGLWQQSEKVNLNGWQQYYRTPTDTNYYTAGTNEFPTTPSPQTPAADVLLALSKYDSAIEELRQAANQFQKSRFPLNYDGPSPTSILFPHLYTFEDCGQVLQLRAVAELENRQSEKALADLKLILRLSDSIRNEPDFYSQLVRLRLLSDIIQPIWEGMAEHRWSDGELAELEQYLGKINLHVDYSFAMHSERASNIATIEFMRRNRSRAVNCVTSITYLGRGDSYEPPIDIDTPVPFMASLISSLVPSGWFYWSEMTIARIYQPLFLATNQNEMELTTVAARRAGTMKGNERQHLTSHNAIALMICPYFEAVSKIFIVAQSSLDFARVACGLERYRLAHGEYPETLDTLAPPFIEKLPHDIINGQPLHYRRVANGQFVLYSVGWNETDDGGQAGLNKDGRFDQRSGDWVWQYPQK
jgi:hypothetical protein